MLAKVAPPTNDFATLARYLVHGKPGTVPDPKRVAWTFGRMSYAAQIDLDSTRVVAGHEALGRVLVRNRATRTVLPARVELAVGRGCRTFELPSLARGAEHEILFSVPTTRRCVVGIGPVRSIKADPIGLFRRERRWAERIDLCVNPRTIPIAASRSDLRAFRRGAAISPWAARCRHRACGRLSSIIAPG